MFCEIKDYVDLENKKALRAPDVTQFLLTLYFFLGSLTIKLKYLTCSGWGWSLWIDFVFYGSLAWLTFLLITLVGKCRSPTIRKFLHFFDFAFLLYFIALWVWLIVIFAKREYLGCSSPVDMFGIVYLVLGAILALLLVLGVLGFGFSVLRPSDKAESAVIFDDATDFNPYNN